MFNISVLACEQSLSPLQPLPTRIRLHPACQQTPQLGIPHPLPNSEACPALPRQMVLGLNCWEEKWTFFDTVFQRCQFGRKPVPNSRGFRVTLLLSSSCFPAP